MRKPKITFRPATIEYAKEFYGDTFTKSFRGYVALLGDKVVGVGGIGCERDVRILFSDIGKEMRPFKRDIAKAIRILEGMVKSLRYPILAIADKKEPASEMLLTKLGFTPSGLANPEGSKIFRRFP